MCTGGNLGKARSVKRRKEQKRGLLGGRMDFYWWADEKKTDEEKDDTGKRLRKWKELKHLLLSVCPLIPQDLSCLPFPRSQC